jgi:hypothetical protein
MTASQISRKMLSTLYGSSYMSLQIGLNTFKMSKKARWIACGRNCTTTFLAYWGDCREYQIWNESKEFQNLWSSLPDDAGVWREVLTVLKSRFTGSMSVDTPWGLNAVVGTKPTLDIGYWGVFRKRMSEVTDKHTVPGDNFTSKYVTQHAKSRAGEGKKIIDLEIPPSSAIRLGRLKVSRVPDNLFFLHEGQRKLKCADGVIGSWMDRVQPLFESFKQHLIKERNKNGIVAYKAYIARKNPSSALNKSRLTNQLIYWLDMAHFELSGRAFHNHIKLRDNGINCSWWRGIQRQKCVSIC